MERVAALRHHVRGTPEGQGRAGRSHLTGTDTWHRVRQQGRGHAPVPSQASGYTSLFSTCASLLGGQATGGPQAHFPTPSAYKHPPCPWVPSTFRGHRSRLLQEALPDVLIHRCLSVGTHPCPRAHGLSHLSVHACTRCPARRPSARPPCLCSRVHTVSAVLSTQQPVSRLPAQRRPSPAGQSEAFR